MAPWGKGPWLGSPPPPSILMVIKRKLPTGNLSDNVPTETHLELCVCVNLWSLRGIQHTSINNKGWCLRNVCFMRVSQVLSFSLIICDSLCWCCLQINDLQSISILNNPAYNKSNDYIHVLWINYKPYMEFVAQNFGQSNLLITVYWFPFQMKGIIRSPTTLLLSATALPNPLKWQVGRCVIVITAVNLFVS